ncbi:MAG: ISAs1 family transposase [Salinivirgaceae bacterium]|nr:ISAs1 family transposase [Salinivirgaceae bacterium]
MAAFFLESIRNNIPGEVNAIDGKAMRGVKDTKASKDMPHIVSAWASENGICLGQVKVSEKSNEITAIPDLVDAIVNKGCTITIDAIGFQKNIAKKIRENEADYILAVKGNQANLEQAIQDTVRFEGPDSINVLEDCGHGRIETRTCKAFSNLSHVVNPDDWADLSTLFVIESHVYKKTTGKESTERRAYMTNLPAIAGSLNSKTRSHWSVENNLH